MGKTEFTDLTVIEERVRLFPSCAAKYGVAGDDVVVLSGDGMSIEMGDVGAVDIDL